jgi:hypothetical protein
MLRPTVCHKEEYELFIIKIKLRLITYICHIYVIYDENSLLFSPELKTLDASKIQSNQSREDTKREETAMDLATDNLLEKHGISDYYLT